MQQNARREYARVVVVVGREARPLDPFPKRRALTVTVRDRSRKRSADDAQPALATASVDLSRTMDQRLATVRRRTDAQLQEVDALLPRAAWSWHRLTDATARASDHADDDGLARPTEIKLALLWRFNPELRAPAAFERRVRRRFLSA